MKVLYGKSFFFCLLILSFFQIPFSQLPQLASESVVEVVNHPFSPGDAVRIELPLDSANFLNGIYPIDEYGVIVLPVAGEFNVSSQSVHQFKEYLRKTYEIYLRFPEIQVSPLIRVSLLGGFIRPGMYYIEPLRSMWDLVLIGGGTTNEKGLNKMRWERNRKVIRKDLIPQIESGQSLKAIGFRSGDQLWTPRETRKISDVLVRDVLPIGTFLMSLFVGISTLKN